MIQRFVYEILYSCPGYAVFKIGKDAQECSSSAPITLYRSTPTHSNVPEQPADPYPLLINNRVKIHNHIMKKTEAKLNFFKYPDGNIPVTEL